MQNTVPHQKKTPLARAAAVAVTVFALLLSSMPAFAQEVYGSIIGNVKDEQGAAIVGATVELASEQRTLTTRTDGQGGYQFLNVLPGRYRVTVQAEGFRTAVREEIPVELGRRMQVDFGLIVGAVGEVVEVSSTEEPIQDVTSSKIATNVTAEEFNLIPKTLNFASVINVAPGARQEDKSAGYQIDGASGSENVFILDGVEVTRIEDGQLGKGKNVPFDFVQEVQIKSAGYEAEYGGATGGVINVVTRSGQNDWHGQARVDFQFDELQAAANPKLRINPIFQDQVDYVEHPGGKDDYRMFAPVLSLSGPILKDRLWFYASWAPQFERTSRPLLLTEFTDTAEVAVNQRDLEWTDWTDYGFGRLDWQPIDRLQTNVSFIRSPSKQEGLYPTGFPYYRTSLLDQFNDNYDIRGGYTPQWQLAGAATYNLTDSLILSFRGGTTYLNDKGLNYGLDTSTPYQYVVYNCVAGSLPNGLPCPAGSSGTGAITQDNFLTFYNITRRNNYNVDATWVTRLFGQQHIIKGGYQLNQLSNKVDEGYPQGRVYYYFGRSYLGERGDYGYYRIDRFGTQGDVSSRNQGLFIQDTWQVHPRLTLNLGLRFEDEYLPTYPIDPEFHPTIDPEDLAGAPDKPIAFGWGDKVAPRIGAAWDVFGDNRLKVYGSFGLFYDTMKYALARGSFGGDIYIIERRTLDTPDFQSVSLTNKPGTQLIVQDARVPSSLAPEPGEQPGIDPDLMPTREREYTVGADYAWTDNLLFGVRFTRKQLDRTIEDVGRHDQDGNEIYTIGNPGFGATQNTQWFSFPAPKAVREYTGLEFRLDKRFEDNWYANVTYLWSKLYGNYSGLAASDELDALGAGRTDPNVNRYWDFPTLLFTATGEETLGRLPTDRPHTLKIYAGYRFNYWGMSTDIGGTQLAYSGTPLTTRVEFLGAEHIAFGRGDLGRTEAFTQTDLLITHRWPVTERVAIKASFNVLNLFDERNESVRYELLTGPGVELHIPCEPGDPCFPLDAYQQYFSLGQAAGDFAPEEIDPRFNLTNVWQKPREARFGFGIEF